MKKRFEVLDGMRGVAAVSVLLLHAWPLIGDGPEIPMSGHFAVDIFFALSGFVIASSYDDQLAAGLSPLDFFRRRLLRIYPLYAVGLVLAALVGAYQIVHDKPGALAPGAFWTSLAFESVFMPSPWGGSPAELYPLNPVAWSLFFELLINLLYAATWRRLTTKVLIVAASAGAIGLWASITLFGDVEGGFDWPGLWIGAARVTYAFSLGVLLKRYAPDGAPVRFPAVLLLAGLGLVLWVDPGPIRPFYEALVVLFVAPLFVWLGAGATCQGTMRKMFSEFGRGSYPLYAIHYPLVAATVLAAYRLHVPFSVAAVLLVVSLLLASPVLARSDEWLRARLTSRGFARITLARHARRPRARTSTT